MRTIGCPRYVSTCPRCCILEIHRTEGRRLTILDTKDTTLGVHHCVRVSLLAHATRTRGVGHGIEVLLQVVVDLGEGLNIGARGDLPPDQDIALEDGHLKVLADPAHGGDGDLHVGGRRQPARINHGTVVHAGRANPDVAAGHWSHQRAYDHRVVVAILGKSDVDGERNEEAFRPVLGQAGEICFVFRG